MDDSKEMVAYYDSRKTDFFTSLDTFIKIGASKGFDFALLDSQNNEGFSILGINPVINLEAYVNNSKTGLSSFINGEKTDMEPLEFINNLIKQNGKDGEAAVPMLSGGCIALLSYNYGIYQVNIADKSGEGNFGQYKYEKFPDISLCFYDLYIICDKNKNECYIVSSEKYKTIDEYEKLLKDESKDIFISGEVKKIPANKKEAEFKMSSDFSKEEYKIAISFIKKELQKRNTKVINMTRRIFVSGTKEPIDVFFYLKRKNPAPFAAFLNSSKGSVVSASPERFIKVVKKEVTTSPIKGTRPRGENEFCDIKLGLELKNSKKDRDELFSVVKVEADDLSRVCKDGIVSCLNECGEWERFSKDINLKTDIFHLQKFPEVFHLACDLKGDLDKNKTCIDLIKEAFPSASIAGAPKQEGIELIEEMEKTDRGLYTGSIGYISLNGDCDFNTIIRTAVFEKEYVTVGAGGGITTESDEDFEYDETCHKAKIIIEALENAE